MQQVRRRRRIRSRTEVEVRGIVAVAGNTFVETIRQPVFGIIMLIAAGLIVLSPLYTMFALLQADRLLMDMGLATIFLAGLLLSAFSAAHVVSDEVENKTVLTVISKPVGRVAFLLGKYLGMALAISVAILLLLILLQLTVSAGIPQRCHNPKHTHHAGSETLDRDVYISLVITFILVVAAAGALNFFFDRPFTSTAVMIAIPAVVLVAIIMWLMHSMVWAPKHQIEEDIFRYDPNLWIAGFLLLLGILVISTIALAASTRLSLVVNVVVCSGVFLVGLSSEFLFGTYADKNLLAKIAYGIVPNLQVFWVAEAIKNKTLIPLDYVAKVSIYGISYMAAVLVVAMGMFHGRQVS